MNSLEKYEETANAIVFKVKQTEFNNLLIKIPKDFRLIELAEENCEDLIFETHL